MELIEEYYMQLCRRSIRMHEADKLQELPHRAS